MRTTDQAEPDAVFVVAINRRQQIALLKDGRTCPFAQMIDCVGEDTDDPFDAAVAVIELPEGRWFPLDLREFEPIRLH